MKADAFATAFHWFRHCYQMLLREEIGRTVESPGEIEDELRHLIVCCGRRNSISSTATKFVPRLIGAIREIGIQRLPKVRR